MALRNGTAPPIPTEAVVGIDEDLTDMVPRLRQRLEQGEAHIEYLREQIEAQNGENNKVRRLLRILVPGEERPKKSPKSVRRIGVRNSSGGHNTGFGISVEWAHAQSEKVLEMADSGVELTQTGFSEYAGIDQTRTSSLFRYLHSIQMIGRAGKSPDRRRHLWRIMDRDAAQREYESMVGEVEA